MDTASQTTNSSGAFTFAMQFLFFLVANAVMIILVVISGKNLCGYQYAFSLTLPLAATVVYGIMFFIIHRKNPFWALTEHKPKHVTRRMHLNALLNGIAWGVNYVCLLIANPYTPGLYQIVFNELNLVFVFLLSTLIFANNYSPFQMLSLVVLFVSGMLPLANTALGGGTVPVGWLLLYLVGAWAIGFANFVTENVMRNLYAELRNGRQFLVSSSQFLFLTNLYSVVVVLGLWFVPWLSEGTETAGLLLRGLGCIWGGTCFAANGTVAFNQTYTDNAHCQEEGWLPNYPLAVASTWISLVLSFVCAYIASVMQRKLDVVYVTVAYALAPVISSIFFVLPTPYKDPLTVWKVLSVAGTLVSAVAYKAGTWIAKTKRDSCFLKKLECKRKSCDCLKLKPLGRQIRHREQESESDDHTASFEASLLPGHDDPIVSMF